MTSASRDRLQEGSGWRSRVQHVIRPWVNDTNTHTHTGGKEMARLGTVITATINNNSGNNKNNVTHSELMVGLENKKDQRFSKNLRFEFSSSPSLCYKTC